MQRESDRWWRQAEADLNAAEVNYEQGIYYLTVWLCQQAVEKGLKCVFLQTRPIEQMPRIHNLMTLGRLVNVPQEVAASLERLNPGFTLGRYPGLDDDFIPAESIDAGRAEIFLNAARGAMAWLREQRTNQ